MLRFTCFTLLLAVACGFELMTSISNDWELFKSIHKKSYSSDEEVVRKEIFRSKVEAMLSHNLKADLGLSLHKLRINEFSDRSDEEFMKMMSNLTYDVPYYNVTRSVATSTIQAPKSRDWTKFMGAVKHQGYDCGSCWAFGVTGLIEGHYSIYKGIKLSLSEQNLIDCARRHGTFGCEGGGIANGLDYVIENGGIYSDTCYPYEGKDGKCRNKATCKKAAAGITYVGHVPYGDERALLEAVGTIGPVGVSIHAVSGISQVGSGIYTSSKCRKDAHNHSIIIVGYGSQKGVPYWICKNSWGTSFGQNGYFKLRRGTNECGVANHGHYPSLKT